MIGVLPEASDGTLTINDDPACPLGECYFDKRDDELWVYLKAQEALAQGDALMPWNASESSVLTAANTGHSAGGDAVAGSHILKYNNAFDSSGEIGTTPHSSKFGENLRIHITEGTGIGQRGTVLSFTDDELTIFWDAPHGRLVSALDGTSKFQLYAPWYAQKASTGRGAMAAAQTAIPKDKYFWGKVEGLGVLLAGAAIAVGDSLTNHASTDGRSIKATAAEIPIFGVAAVIGQAAGDLIEAYLKCNIQISKVRNRHRTGPYQQSYQFPTA